MLTGKFIEVRKIVGMDLERGNNLPAQKEHDQPWPYELRFGDVPKPPRSDATDDREQRINWQQVPHSDIDRARNTDQHQGCRCDHWRTHNPVSLNPTAP